MRFKRGLTIMRFKRGLTIMRFKRGLTIMRLKRGLTIQWGLNRTKDEHMEPEHTLLIKKNECIKYFNKSYDR